MLDVLIALSVGFFLGVFNSLTMLQMWRYRSEASRSSDGTQVTKRSITWSRVVLPLVSVYFLVAFWLFITLTDRIDIGLLWVAAGFVTGFSWPLLLFWIGKQGKVRAEETRFEHYLKERIQEKQSESRT